MKRLNEIPLRERKHAQTKLALMKIAESKILEKPFSEITVKELCNEVQISDATFFNYFSKKSDLLVYYIQLWTLDMSWYEEHSDKRKSSLKKIESVFIRTAEKMKANSRIMNEIISFMALTESPLEFKELPNEERYLAFPELEEIENISSLPFDKMFLEKLNDAIKSGELPKKVDIQAAMTGLLSIFFGIPLLFSRYAPHLIGQFYKSQLSIFWQGLINYYSKIKR
ncbi:MAG: transcriptional regulator [Ignavibacteria bacterium]|nr:transcriptional regulator [Ignavibacteria bacterium]